MTTPVQNIPPALQTELTRMMDCRYPIIVAPMFLVSDVNMVVEGSEAGAIGTFPALNARPVEKFRDWVQEIKGRTDKPFGVNLIVNRSNIYYEKQLAICLDEKVPMIIASLGSPVELIQSAHGIGTRVFCDVITTRHAEKAVDAGADGLVAVTSGAGGHGGNISPFVLIPWLRRQFKLPVLAASGIADGAGLGAALQLGACGVSVGTRFIASSECPVGDDYKQAIVAAAPEDIVTTYKLDGVAANVINTPYVRRRGTQLSWIERTLRRSKKLRPLLMGIRALMAERVLKDAAQKTTWKQLWGAGQVSGLIDQVLPIETIVHDIVREYYATQKEMPHGELIPEEVD